MQESWINQLSQILSFDAMFPAAENSHSDGVDVSNEWITINKFTLQPKGPRTAARGFAPWIYFILFLYFLAFNNYLIINNKKTGDRQSFLLAVTRIGKIRLAQVEMFGAVLPTP